MRNPLTPRASIFVILYAFVVVPFFLSLYIPYLKRPDNKTWYEVRDYLMDFDRYKSESVVFEPDWLKNYAIDNGRFAGITIERPNKNLDKLWFISYNTKIIPKGFMILEYRQIGDIKVMLLERVDNNN